MEAYLPPTNKTPPPFRGRPGEGCFWPATLFSHTSRKLFDSRRTPGAARAAAVSVPAASVSTAAGAGAGAAVAASVSASTAATGPWTAVAMSSTAAAASASVCTSASTAAASSGAAVAGEMSTAAAATATMSAATIGGVVTDAVTVLVYKFAAGTISAAAAGTVSPTAAVSAPAATTGPGTTIASVMTASTLAPAPTAASTFTGVVADTVAVFIGELTAAAVPMSRCGFLGSGFRRWCRRLRLFRGSRLAGHGVRRLTGAAVTRRRALFLAGDEGESENEDAAEDDSVLGHGHAP